MSVLAGHASWMYIERNQRCILMYGYGLVQDLRVATSCMYGARPNNRRSALNHALLLGYLLLT